MSEWQDHDQRWSNIIRVGETMAARMGGKFVVDVRRLADIKAKDAMTTPPERAVNKGLFEAGHAANAPQGDL